MIALMLSFLFVVMYENIVQLA